MVVDARTKAGQTVAVYFTQLLLNEFGLTGSSFLGLSTAHCGRRRWVQLPAFGVSVGAKLHIQVSRLSVPATVWQMSMHPDGRCLAAILGVSGSYNGRVELVDCDGVLIADLPDTGPGDSVRSAHAVRWSPSGNRLAVADHLGLSVFRLGTE